MAVDTQIEKEIRKNTLNKAQLLSRMKNPMDLFAKGHPVYGILFVTSGELPEAFRNDEDAAVCMNQQDEELAVMKLLGRNASRQSLENARHAFLEAMKQYHDLQEQARQIQKEMNRANSAYKSAKAQNEWLNRENQSGTVRQGSLEQQMDELEKAVSENQKKADNVMRRLEKLALEIPKQKDLYQENDAKAKEAEQAAREKQGELKLSDRIFHPGHVDEIRREAAALFVQADNLHIEASKAASRLGDLMNEEAEKKQKKTKLKTELAHLQKQLDITKQTYEEQVSSLKAGTVMTEEQDERTKSLDKRIRKLENSLKKTKNQTQEAEDALITEAKAYINAFASSEDFRMVLLDQDDSDSSEQKKLLAILFASSAMIVTEGSREHIRQMDLQAEKEIDL